MPAAQRASDPGRPRFSYRSLPLWLQWAIPFAIATVAVIALVKFVNHETYDTPAEASVSSPNAIVEENREDTIIVRGQQAPHISKLAAGMSAGAGIDAAVERYMRYEVGRGFMAGPLKSSSCQAAGGTSSRQLFRCSASAGDLIYPFDGVVSAGVITYCQRVAPPVPSLKVPVSKRCT